VLRISLFLLVGIALIFFPQFVFAITPDIHNPGVSIRICADDPAFVSNAEGHMYDTELDQFLYWCPEEYEGYSPTTRFSVLIYAPSWNTDPYKIDSIGNTQEHPITVYTSLGSARLAGVDGFALPCTGFSELGPDTGLFQGNVLMTGFQYDYDGDGVLDTVPPLWDFTDCGSASAFGTVQSAAFLQTEKTGGITVAWEVTENLTLVKSANYSFREAEISFDKTVYNLEEEVTVIMNDLDYMLYDGYDFPWLAKVWSDSDLAGINVKIFWEEDFTYATPYFLQSEFYGKFTLTNTDKSLSDGRLRVTPGDKIYVEFNDYSLPSPYGDGDFITVSDSAKIIFSDESYSGISLNEVKPTNYLGDVTERFNVDDTITIQAQVENHTLNSKTVTCILLIRNSNGIYEHISWAMMNLPAESITEINQSWRNNAEDTFTAEVYIWEQMSNAIPLTQNKETSFVVSG